MLSPATEFPQQGSFCLYQDPEPDALERGPQLARIIRWIACDATAASPRDECLVSLPMREGAGGNRTVTRADLIDATPLSRDEEREMADLGRQIRNRPCRSKRLREAKARHDALRSRLIWSGCMRRKLDQLAERQRRRAA